MLGFSLSPGYFLPAYRGELEKEILNCFGGLHPMLRYLRGLGIGSIEFRTIPPTMDGEAVLRAAETVWREGFDITVHGAIAGEIHPFPEAYPALLPLLGASQKPIIITVHAWSKGTDREENARITLQTLALWSRDGKRMGFRLALEENREKGIADPGDSTGGVEAILKGLPDTICGSCFDFGHHCYNMGKAGKPEATLPEADFLARAIHTHIHACAPDGTTHMPMAEPCHLPLDTYVSALKAADYTGVWNLELSFERFGNLDIRESIRTSVHTLAGAVGEELPTEENLQIAQLFRVLNTMPGEIRRIAGELREDGNDGFWMVSHAGYVLRLNGTGIAIDPAVRGEINDKIASAWQTLLDGVEAIFITHDHIDHLDFHLFERLHVHCPVYIADVCDPTVLEKMKLDHIVPLGANAKVQIGNITVRTFPGRHFAPDGSGTGSVSLLLAWNGKTFFLPGDTRDYGLDLLPDIPPPDYMAANIWLGRLQALSENQALLGEFTRMIREYHPGRLYLGHLWDATRTPEDMWSFRHAGRVRDILEAYLPGTEVESLAYFSHHLLL